MSRHSFDTRYQNRAVQVVLGYNRGPLCHVFLTILFAEPAQAPTVTGSAPGSDCEDSDADTVLYSHLEDPQAGFKQNLDYYRTKLVSFGITVPESMFHETVRDVLRDAGNRIVHHHEDGRLETLSEG